MLKVTVHDSANELRIQIEGKLTAPWVTELESCWRTAQPAAVGKPVIADLVDVDYADLAGRYLLAWMFASGVRFVSRSLPMQQLISEITGQPPEVPPSRPQARTSGLRRLGMLFALFAIHLPAQPLTLTLRRAVEIASSAEGSPRLQIADESVTQAEARAKQQRASLLPNVDGYGAYQDQTRNLAAFGLNVQLPVPGFSIPTFVGPFSTVDLRASASQSVFDIAFAIVGVVQVIMVTTVALLVFRVPFRGNPLLLLGCAVLYLMTTLGAGLFISTISQTQQQAMMAVFFFTTPAFMLSGFAFPIQNMPVLVQWVTYLNPLRYFMEIVRGIFLKGTGVEILWPQMLALFAYGVAVIGLSAMRFHKSLD